MHYCHACIKQQLDNTTTKRALFHTISLTTVVQFSTIKQYQHTLCPDKKWTPKEIAIMQQKLVRLV